jgi:hypothetical protein
MRNLETFSLGSVVSLGLRKTEERTRAVWDLEFFASSQVKSEQLFFLLVGVKNCGKRHHNFSILFSELKQFFRRHLADC